MTKLLVVSDSSSLILVTKAGLLETLCSEFFVEIPGKVFQETVVVGKELQKIDAFEIEQVIENKKIKVKKIKAISDKKVIKLFTEFNLDLGEMEAIVLYLQTKANLLLVDDKQAINTAKLLEINWATIPGIIVDFYKRKKISKERALEALKTAQIEGRYKIDFILKAFNEIEK